MILHRELNVGHVECVYCIEAYRANGIINGVGY